MKLIGVIYFCCVPIVAFVPFVQVAGRKCAYSTHLSTKSQTCFVTLTDHSIENVRSLKNFVLCPFGRSTVLKSYHCHGHYHGHCHSLVVTARLDRTHLSTNQKTYKLLCGPPDA
ncbi:hypothetical protein PF005_g18020 [Phytophthora fragariae]|uniref:Uncharacterized protein n=1 Tax=Phytophthora fragariae TaxID=53985 RepID=A0A6A3T300_9STRA|nr:hypothetical protein PF003_g40842 [Phytophthora fragariae]KAE8945369.1 hypothetical protein PF009_g4988 [Phytophthora fragariae]KAE8993964.1 hypothetical protein PF011_g16928 [Phytophthora fragariae]KAE9127354.1 hypothetical protein PF006_g16528 [Phytophthora fragariae]KAE9128617.1 hypothetical protein PF007_g5202 [Phytophthora fragariae]